MHPDNIGSQFISAGDRARKCNCEHADHFDTDNYGNSTPVVGHAYGALMSEPVTDRAEHVGLVCRDCAQGHMAEYLR